MSFINVEFNSCLFLREMFLYNTFRERNELVSPSKDTGMSISFIGFLRQANLVTSNNEDLKLRKLTVNLEM
jgi:hypothetical protein